MDAISTTSPISGTTIFKRRRTRFYALYIQSLGLLLLVAGVVALKSGEFGVAAFLFLLSLHPILEGDRMSTDYICKSCRSKVSGGPFCPGCGLEILD